MNKGPGARADPTGHRIGRPDGPSLTGRLQRYASWGIMTCP